ncbi:MAG TPA: PH domain-containing protein [Flavitalea sp.]|nr:PH domain-containing protein [Flavitalea sp.]
MENKRFYANTDSVVKLVTNIVIGAAMLIFALNVLSSSLTVDSAPPILFLLFPLIVLTWGIHPVYYVITQTSIKVKRPFGSIEYPLYLVEDVRPIHASELGFRFRLFASGGLFGYLGLYHSAKIGQFVMWCTNQEELIMITCRGRKIIISPSDSSAFFYDYLARRNGKNVI